MESDEGYTHNPYQVYLAAKLLQSKKRWNLLKLAPGQGKSYIMILMAMQLYKLYQRKSVFLTTTEMLKMQMQQMIDSHVTDARNYITVVASTTVRELVQEHNKTDYFFVDEGDVFIKNHLLNLDSQTNTLGLMALENRQVYLFTATLSQHYREILIEALTGGVVSIIDAKPSLAYTKLHISDVNNFTGAVVADEAHCIAELSKRIKVEARL